MISSSNTQESGNVPIQAAEESFNLKRIILRALPYWPLFPIMIGVLLTAAHFYLKYQVPVYQVTARVVVNDGEQEKGSNFFQSLRPYGAADKETEKEKEILQSKALVAEVIRDEHLNIRWTKKGRLATVPQFNGLPLELLIEDADSIRKFTEGPVNLLEGNRVSFNGINYPLDSFVQSPFGKIKWVLHEANEFTNEWILTLMPVKSASSIFRGQLGAASISKQSAIIDLTLIETVPERGVVFLTSLLEHYGKNNVSFKNRVYQNTVKFVEERLRIVSDELSGVESKLEQFKSKEGITNLSTEGEISLRQLKENDQKAAEIDLQLTVLQKIEQYLNTRNRTPDAIPATLGLTDPILLGLLNQLYAAEFEVEKMRKLSGEKNPQLEVLEESLLKLRPSILASIKNLRISLQSGKEKLSREGSDFITQLKSIPQKERALLEISRQQQIKNNIYTYLLQKREESILSAAAQVPNHRVINEPELAGQVAPKAKTVYTIAMFLALALVCIFIFFKEFSGNKVLFSSDLERITGIPLLGELVYSRRAEENTVIEPSERILIAEQLRDLRTNLSYTHIAKQGAQVILITSSISGEGKSFISINLAAALSRVDKKVLLMECDLRKPMVTKKLNMTKAKGLTDFLIGTAEIKEIIRPVDNLENVFLISSGAVPPNPVELLMNGHLQPLMEDLKKQFDYILIDSPPAAILTDAKVLAMEADSTLYVVRYNYTPLDFLPFLKQQAIRNTLPRISLVFNGVVRKKVPGYGYSSDYGYGYGYGYIKEDSKIKKTISRLSKRSNS